MERTGKTKELPVLLHQQREKNTLIVKRHERPKITNGKDPWSPKSQMDMKP